MMRHPAFTQLLAAAALAAAFGTVQAGAVDALKTFNADADGLSGSFTQTVQNKKRTQTSSGTFQIQRPGLFKWEYTRPGRQLIIGDGKTVWHYDAELKQAVKSDQKQAIGSSPAAILADKSALDTGYALKEDGSADGVDYVLATPKSSNAGYKSIRIGFKDGQLAAMQLQDSFGNRTQIRFANLNTQPNLSASQFRFTPPKGVDVMSR
uniref:outer membrane lipoprotein chaperone LolA n=1 Tax=Neisseria leonii TaxID=2995413 RepID=UPI003F588FC0